MFGVDSKKPVTHNYMEVSLNTETFTDMTLQ